MASKGIPLQGSRKREDLTDRQLLNRYCNLWMPAKPPKKPDDSQENTEDLIDLAKKNAKGYDNIIKELRYKHKCKEIQDDIEDAIVNRALMRQLSDVDWKDVEKQSKKIEALWEEYQALEDE
jgi:hypothetical protein